MCFKDHPNFNKIMYLYRDTINVTSYGQLIDTYKIPLENYSMDTYIKITHMKTAYYTFYLPIAVAYAYMNKCDDKTLKYIKDISMKIGEYFQIQDDYLDCFGDPEIVGKDGTDIEDKKCTWLLVKCFELCNDEDRKILYNNIGKGNEERQRIKDIYKKYDLPNIYNKLEDEYKEY